MEYIRQIWSRSKMYRVIMVITAMLLLLRLTAGLLYWVDWEDESGIGMTLPNDLQIYREAAAHLQQRQDLYPQDALPVSTWFYEYPPAVTAAFIPLLWPSATVLVPLSMLLNIVGYGLLYIMWGRIFRRLGLNRINEMMAWTLPVWAVFSAFWYGYTYLNIGVFVALSAALLTESILNERLGWSLLWLSIILQTKPQWAFAVAIPLLLGRRRFFFKLVGLAIVVYIAIAGVMVLATGPTYGVQQYVNYFQQLQNYRDNWPWRGPDTPFLGYNHSITQVTLYLLGVSPSTLHLATLVKIFLLIPLGIISVRFLLKPTRCKGCECPTLSLELAFVLYLGAYIWLDAVFEVLQSIVVFVYLAAKSKQQYTKICVWIVFLAYALAEIWLLIAGLVGPTSDDGYALWNPGIHLPLTMLVVLVFYVLLVKRLWNAHARIATEMKLTDPDSTSPSS